MTRRKKNKSAASGQGAAALSAPGQSASAGVPQRDAARLGASGSDVTLKKASTSKGSAILGVHPVYLESPPRTASSPAPRHTPQAPRPAYASYRPRPVYPVTAPHPVTASSGPRSHPRPPFQRDHNTSSGPLPDKTSVGHRPVTASCDPNVTKPSSTGSPAQSEVATSVVSVSSANTSDFKGNKSKKKPKQNFKVNVTYETKEIHIYPRQPILIVERLKNLEYHVGLLTEAVGRRPRVYPHGKSLRFVPETDAEYKAIKHYLARIEAQERIAWCSYSLPPGNSLKVNVKVRVVERIKIVDDLTKLKLEDGKNGKPIETEKKDTVENVPKSVEVSEQNKTKSEKSSPGEEQVSTTTSVPINNKNNVHQISTSNSGQLALKTKDKEQAAVDTKLAAAGSVQQSAKKSVKVVSDTKKTVETVKISPGSIIRTNKMF